MTDEEAARELGDYAKYFYTIKASKAEKHAGVAGSNPHPCVKGIDLMRYLVRLITPVGGTCLDMMMGSGTTGVACVLEHFSFIGFDSEPEYVTIAQARIEHWQAEGNTH
jgi:DNA modification methylase